MVSINVLTDSLARYRDCQCHKLGLLPGIYVDDLWMLGSGCTSKRPDGAPGYVCPRLDCVRRAYKPWERLQAGEERVKSLKPEGKPKIRKRRRK